MPSSSLPVSALAVAAVVLAIVLLAAYFLVRRREAKSAASAAGPAGPAGPATPRVGGVTPEVYGLAINGSNGLGVAAAWGLAHGATTPVSDEQEQDFLAAGGSFAAPPPGGQLRGGLMPANSGEVSFIMMWGPKPPLGTAGVIPFNASSWYQPS